MHFNSWLTLEVSQKGHLILLSACLSALRGNPNSAMASRTSRASSVGSFDAQLRRRHRGLEALFCQHIISHCQHHRCRHGCAKQYLKCQELRTRSEWANLLRYNCLIQLNAVNRELLSNYLLNDKSWSEATPRDIYNLQTLADVAENMSWNLKEYFDTNYPFEGTEVSNRSSSRTSTSSQTSKSSSKAPPKSGLKSASSSSTSSTSSVSRSPPVPPEAPPGRYVRTRRDRTPRADIRTRHHINSLGGWIKVS